MNRDYVFFACTFVLILVFGVICRFLVKMRAWAIFSSFLCTHLILDVTATENKCY